MIASRLSTLGEESGGVLVITAAGLTALILFVSFVVDAANWKVHQRHLQLQADAAALAGAHSLASSGCSDSLISADAHNYGGPDASGTASLYNEQLGGTPASKMHLLINSAGYYGDSGAGDNTDPNGSPCTAKYVDVKVTETGLPWYLGFGGIVSNINAHARVALVQETSANGTLPVAVPNPLPTSAAALFINEGTGAVLASTLLDDQGTGVSGLDVWDNSLRTPPLVTVAPATGVVIALSGRRQASLASLLASNDLATICDSSLTDCYDASTDPPTKGLLYIRGYAETPSGQQPNSPQLRGVGMFGTACSGGTPYFSNGTCIYDFVARVDAGDLVRSAQIYAANGVQLQPMSLTDTNCVNTPGDPTVGCWHASLTLPADAGATAIGMTWEETSGQVQIAGKLEDCRISGGNKCKGNYGVVHRTYSAHDATSGPIKAAELRLCDNPSCPPAVPSYPATAQHRFGVAIGIAGALQNAADKFAPLVVLRVRSQANQALDCDPGYSNLKQELELGCRPTYVPNAGSPDCATLGTSALWATQQPWSCIAVSTGAQPNDVAAGLNARLYQGDQKPAQCAAPGTKGHNNWSMFNLALDNDGFPEGDPRILNAYITTYGAFSHVNGTSGSVPIVTFGHFYVTGYTGQGGGFNNPCYPGSPSNYTGADPDDRVPNDDPGLIVGRFIYYVDKIGGDGVTPCDPSSITACAIVMTK